MKKRLIKDYILEEEIGKGMFSTVYHCKHQITGNSYACKKFIRSKMTKNSLKNLQEEIKVLSNLPHSDHIIRLHQVIKTKNHFYLIVDYCNGGDLESVLE
jgi:serine/threonine-protein kinase ULK2